MRRIRGFTLIELLVALAVGMLVTSGIMAVLISSATVYKKSDNRAGIQENARFALTLMQEDARMAGFMGCFNFTMFPSRFKNLAVNPTSFVNNYTKWVGGLEASATSWSPALDPNEIGVGGHAPVVGNDILFLRSPSGPSIALSAPMAVTADIPVANTSGFSAGTIAIVSDCDYANLVIVSAAPTATAIPHGTGSNTSGNMTHAFSNVKGSTVTPVTTVTYFLAASSDGISGNTSLWRQVGITAAEEVAEGVSKLQFEFGVDTKATPDGITTKFVTADLVGTLPVTAVKVSMLLRSRDASMAMSSQTYKFGGTSTTANDKRLYVPFTTTIALRNGVK